MYTTSIILFYIIHLLSKLKDEWNNSLIKVYYESYQKYWDAIWTFQSNVQPKFTSNFMITLKHTIECWGAIYLNIWYNITTKIDFKFTRPELPVDAVLRSRRCHEVGRVAAVDDKPSHWKPSLYWRRRHRRGRRWRRGRGWRWTM